MYFGNKIKIKILLIYYASYMSTHISPLLYPVVRNDKTGVLKCQEDRFFQTQT